MKSYSILFILLVCSHNVWAPGVHLEAPVGEHFVEHSGVDFSVVDPAHEASVKTLGDEGIAVDHTLSEVREHKQDDAISDSGRVASPERGRDLLNRIDTVQERDQSLEDSDYGGSEVGDVFEASKSFIPLEDVKVGEVIPEEGVDEGRASVSLSPELAAPLKPSMTSFEIRRRVGRYKDNVEQWGDGFDQLTQDVSLFKKKGSKAIFADYNGAYQKLEVNQEQLEDTTQLLDDFTLKNADSLSDEEMSRINDIYNTIKKQKGKAQKLKATLEKLLESSALKDMQQFNREARRMIFSSGNSKSLAKSVQRINEIRMVLERALIDHPEGDALYKSIVESTLKFTKDQEAILQGQQLKALQKDDLLPQAKNAIAILESQTDVRYAASSRGRAEVADAKAVLKKMNTILYTDPLHTEYSFDKHSTLSFELLGKELKRLGIKLSEGQSMDEFMSSEQVRNVSSRMFGINADPGQWKDSLDYNLALNTRNKLEKLVKSGENAYANLKNYSLFKGAFGKRRLQRISKDNWAGKARKSSSEFVEVQPSEKRQQDITRRQSMLPSRSQSAPNILQHKVVDPGPVRSASVPTVNVRKDQAGVQLDTLPEFEEEPYADDKVIGGHTITKSTDL
jgi:hypothetical protein